MGAECRPGRAGAVPPAVSGKQMTPGGAFEIAEILGKDESIRRIKIGIEKLEKALA